MPQPEWADTTDLALMNEVADFFADQIADDASYVSHGEIQTGLSEDGRTWHPDLRTRLREDLADCGEERDVVVVRVAGQLAGAAIVLWVETDRVSFAVIEDMTTLKRQRSEGLGAAMMAFIETSAKARGARWLFLESGLQNHRAHAFFDRAGFRTLSKVFGKPL